MRSHSGCRAALGLLATMALIVLVSPRTLPRSDLPDPTSRAAAITEFGLRTMAALLAGYLAVVFLGLFLNAVRLLPSSLGALVDRWTTRGLAGGLRRCVGLSAMAIGVLPLQPVAAHATEDPPVLAPDDATPPPSVAPRLVPLPPVAPEPSTPGSRATEPPTAEPVHSEPPQPPPAPPDPEPPPSAPTARRPSAGQLIVRPGDSFWTVAERMTSARLGRPAGDAEVVEPWLALMAANRDRLADPEDPDLVFPGQVLRLPD